MKKITKKILAVAFVFIMAIGMVACGDKTQTLDPNRLIYVADFKNLDLGLSENEWTNSEVYSNGVMYYLLSKYDEKTEESSTKLCSKSLLDDSAPVQNDIKLEDNCYAQSMMVNDDGTITMVVSSYDDQTGNSATKFMNVKTNGEVINTIDLTEAMKKTQLSYVQSVCYKDNCYFMTGSSNNGSSLVVVDKDGKYLFDLQTERWFDDIFVGPDNKVYVSGYGTEGMELKAIDVATKSFESPLEVDLNNARSFYAGKDNNLLISSDISMKSYNMDTKEITTLWNWIDIDLSTDNVTGCLVNEDGTYTITSSSYEDQMKYEIATVSQKKASEVAQKTTLVYGVLYLDYSIRNKIVSFNKSNPDYRITVKSYSDEYSDWEEARNKMNMDIASGNAIDIIDLSNGKYTQLANSGVLEDLNPYFDNDAELNRSDYFESVLNALQVDGKLMAIAPSFSVQSLMGRKADIGDKKTWTMDDVIAFADANPGKKLLPYASKSSILYTMLMYNMNAFMDWEKGECHFDSDEFIKLLNFANKFEEDMSGDDNSMKDMQDGKVLLAPVSTYSVQELQVYKSLLGDDVVLIGYPTSEGCGNSLSPQGMFGISSKSKYKDGAWQFIRNFLSKEYQTSNDMYGMPLLKSAFDEMMTEEMTPETYVDENGVTQERSKGGMGFGNDFMYEYYHAEQEDVDMITEAINSVDKVMDYDEQIFTIISEETEAFFKGQKTAEDVATIIQSRIQIYVKENK